MFIVYVLESQKNGKRYVGMTSKSISERLDWHRWGLTSWTKQNGPFNLLHTEELQTKSDALRREQYLKTGQGRRTLDHILKGAGGSVSATERGGPAKIFGGG